MNRVMTILAAAALFVSFAAAEANAQTWQMLASFPGRPAGLTVTNIDPGLLDFNGDKMADMAMLVVDPSNPNVVYLNIRSGADPRQQWQLSLRSNIFILNLLKATMMGFYDFDGTVNQSNPKEILVAQKVNNHYVNPTVLYNIDVTNGTYQVSVPDGGTILLGGWDLDNDGAAELIVGNPDVKAVQVWGIQ